jgi:MATE family multidrug resistance protein
MAVGRLPVITEIRTTLLIAAPLVAANLAQMAMQVTNAVMVGHLGATSLAAAGLGNALNATLLMTAQGLLTAVAPLAAHAVGAGDTSSAGRVAGGGMIVAAALALPMMSILIGLPLVLSSLGYETDLVAEIHRFLWAICWGVPGFLGAAVLRFRLIAAFRTRVVMVVPLLAVPLNLALNWVLIFGHGGVAAMGSAGSGCATAIVQWLTLLSFAVYMLVAKRRISISVGRGVLHHISSILRLGLPIAAMRGLEIGLFVMTGVMMGVVGADALGAHQLVFNVAGVCFMVPLGLSQAATVRVAYQLGQGAPAAAGRAAYTALAIGAVFMMAAAVLLSTMPRMLIGLYLDLTDPANQGLLAIALQLFAIAALFQLFDGAQVIAAGALRGYRDTAVPMAIAAIGYWAIGFAGGWLLAFPFSHGAVGLWLGLLLGLAVVAISLSVRLQSRIRAHRRVPGSATLAASGPVNG